MMSASTTIVLTKTLAIKPLFIDNLALSGSHDWDIERTVTYFWRKYEQSHLIAPDKLVGVNINMT